MPERQIELKRRYHRKGKMAKLKAKLAGVTGPDREKIIYKIKRLSPWWTEASLTQGNRPAAAAEKPSEPKKTAPKPKAPPRPKAAAEKK